MSTIENKIQIQGAVLQQARMAKNLSLAEVAKELCCSTNQLQQIEGGQSSLFYNVDHQNQVARKLANYLGVPLTQAFHTVDPEVLVPEEDRLENPSNWRKVIGGVLFFSLIIFGLLFVIYSQQ